MITMTWESIFGPITGKRNRSRDLGKPFSKMRTLEEDTWFNGYEYAKGSKWRAFETEDFGFVLFDRKSKTPDGNIPGKFIHRY